MLFPKRQVACLEQLEWDHPSPTLATPGSSLSLANNPLCYSVNYGTWSLTTDYLPIMQFCRGCVDLCLNGGTCQAGPVAYSCVCPNNFTGEDCGTLTTISCGPGTTLSSGICKPCPSGTFSTSGLSCVPCQMGTASDITAATEGCTPCSAGSYAATTAATLCKSCPS